MIGWHQAKMAIPCQQMFKIYYEPHIFIQKPTKDQLTKWENEVIQCLKALDYKLVENQYLCGNKLTLGDLVVFNDFAMFLELKGYSIDSQELAEYPNLTKWFNLKMLQNPQVKEVYNEMKDTLKKAKKNQPSS